MLNLLIVFVLGLLIGWIIEWIIDWRFWRVDSGGTSANASSADDAETQRLREQMRQAEGEIERLRGELATSRESSVGDAPDERARDPLQKISGIGNVFAGRLNGAGIYTFAELAKQSPERLREIVDAQEWQSVDPESWIEQAEQFARQLGQ